MVDCPSAFPAFVFVELGGEVTMAGRAEGNGEEQGGVKEMDKGEGVDGECGEGGRETGREEWGSC